MIDLDKYFEASETEKIEMSLNIKPKEVVEVLLNRPVYISESALEKLERCNERFRQEAPGKEFFMFLCRLPNTLGIEDVYLPEDQELFVGSAPTKSNFLFTEVQKEGLYPIVLYHSHHSLGIGANFSPNDEGMHEGFTCLAKENAVRCYTVFNEELKKRARQLLELYVYGEPCGIKSTMLSSQSEEQINQFLLQLSIFSASSTTLFSYSFVDTYSGDHGLRLRLRPLCYTCERILNWPSITKRPDVKIKNGFIIKDGLEIKSYKSKHAPPTDFISLEGKIDRIARRARGH